MVLVNVKPLLMNRVAELSFPIEMQIAGIVLHKTN